MLYFTPLTYTPIAIQWLHPFLDPEGSPIVDVSANAPARIPSSYWMKITAPRSNRKGLQQHLPETLRVDIPAEGLLRMQLIPSNRYLPQGRYKVEYYRKGCSVRIDAQDWIVPGTPPVLNYSFPYSEYSSSLPYDVWSILQITPGDYWVADFNNLAWTGSTPLEPDALISVSYQPAVTLDQLIQHNPLDPNANASTWY